MKRVFAAPFIGELGHELLFWQAHLRWFRRNQFKDDEFNVLCWPGHECLYEFATKVESIPAEFCTEEVLQNQSTALIHEEDESNPYNQWFKKYMLEAEADEWLDPKHLSTIKYRHGYHDLMGNRHYQIFTLLQASPHANEKASLALSHEVWRWGKYIVVYPRHKPGQFASRNWGHWAKTIKFLKRQFTGFKVVVVGVKSLTDPEALKHADLDIILPSNGTDLDLQIALLANACFAVTPISGCTSLSLLSGCPTFIIGPGKCSHHLLYRNIFQTRAFYYSDWNDKDIMPSEVCLMDVFGRIETFGAKSYNGRFSV